jgi:hypothetical protein
VCLHAAEGIRLTIQIGTRPGATYGNHDAGVCRIPRSTLAPLGRMDEAVARATRPSRWLETWVTLVLGFRTCSPQPSSRWDATLLARRTPGGRHHRASRIRLMLAWSSALKDGRRRRQHEQV